MSLETSIPMPKKAEPATGIFITHQQAAAINVMISAITVAQKAGAYSLKDSSFIYETLACFRTQEMETAEGDVEKEGEEAAS